MTNQQTSQGQGLGIAGLVLGIIALIISFIPCLGMYALVPGIVAIVLSAIGLSQASKANAAKGLTIAALVISILGTSIAAWQFIVLRAAADKIEQGVEGWTDELQDAIEELDEDGSLESLEDALDDLEEAVEDIGEEVEEAFEEAAKDIEDELDDLEDDEDEK
jgi:membrane-bound ClpP family serine protease